MGDCLSAEDWFIRSTTFAGRIYLLSACGLCGTKLQATRTSLKNEVDGIDERAESAFYGNTTDEGINKKDSAYLFLSMSKDE